MKSLRNILSSYYGGEQGKCLTTLLFHHHPTQVHYWPHCSSITTLHKYTTGHTTLPSPPYTSTPLATLLFHHHPHKYTTGHASSITTYTSTPLATLLFHHRPTQVHYWPHYSSITTLLQIECTTHLSSATPPPRSRESNEPFEEKRCHYMKSLRNILFSSDGCERD